MARSKRSEPKLPKGVIELPRARGGRKFRAAIREKGLEVHLGLYETSAQAAFAYNVAAKTIGRGTSPPNELLPGQTLSADQVLTITRKVRRRLGLDRPISREPLRPPSLEALKTFFEVTVIGFWKSQIRADGSQQSMKAVARRIVEAAELIFWENHPNSPTPLSVLEDFLARRLTLAFHQPEVTRQVLEDDGDDPFRIALWLILPEESPGNRSFLEQVRYLYGSLFEESEESSTGWADVLGLTPPISARMVRDAYRRRSKTLHPDAGGSHVEFVRLNAAYEQAVSYLRIRGEEG